MADTPLIIVFTKPAVPGQVKTRLVPPLTPEQAVAFHMAALADTVAVARRVADDNVELHVAGDQKAVEAFRDIYPDLKVREQCGADLGDRLTFAFAAAFARGRKRALIVGSDHPTLPPDYLVRALGLLASVDVVFGRSRDGGYYAVATREDSWPKSGEVFRQIPWSTPAVLEQSLQRARASGLTVAATSEWYDVDCAEDLEWLRRDANQQSASTQFLRTLERGLP